MGGLRGADPGVVAACRLPEDVADAVIDTHTPWAQGLVEPPWWPHFPVLPCSGNSSPLVHWMLTAEVTRPSHHHHRHHHRHLLLLLLPPASDGTARGQVANLRSGTPRPAGQIGAEFAKTLIAQARDTFDRCFPKIRGGTANPDKHRFRCRHSILWHHHHQLPT